MSIRISTSGFQQDGIQGITDRQLKLNQIQNTIATGKKVNKPSDDPVNAAVLSQLQESQVRTEQYQKNINLVTARLEMEENQLKEISERSLIRIKELAIAAINGARTAQDRFAIAEEMRQQLEHMVTVANSRGLGAEYLFSGAREAVAPIQRDSTGAYTYQGDELIQTIPIGPSNQVAVNDTGKSVFFDVPAADVSLISRAGLSQVSSVSGGLVNIGTLPVLTAGQLRINQVGIPVPLPDGVSTTDATASAKTLAAAINSKRSEHNVLAIVDDNTQNLTAPTYGALANGDLTLNGVPIVGTNANQTELIDLINAQTTQTGVTAEISGADVLLRATDGRNIQLQTLGSAASGATFTNFSLIAAAANQVKQGTVTLQSDQAIVVGGTLPAQAGLVAGTTALTANTGNVVWLSADVVGVAEHEAPPPTTETFRIQINNGNTYSVYSTVDPKNPLADYTNVAYTPGQDITVTVQGVEMVLRGVPAANDQFFLELKPKITQDVFTSISNLINTIQNNGGFNAARPYYFSYQVGVGLTNLNTATDHLGEVQAQVGTKLALTDSQKLNNEQFIFLTQKSSSQIEDLDIYDAIRELTMCMTSLEAAQKSFLKIQSINLFSIL